MYCPMCGFQNADSDNFCSRCGHRLVPDTVFERPSTEGIQPQGDFAFSTYPPLTFQYAGFWRRLTAFWFDWMILFGITIAFSIPLMIIRGIEHVPDALHLFPSRNPLSPAGFVLNLLLAWLYHAILESSKMQATLGKRMIGIKVADYKGKRISFGSATLRHFSKIISACLFFTGFLMIAVTRKKQGLHDKIAKCLVLKRLP